MRDECQTNQKEGPSHHSHLGFEEVDGDAVVLQAVHPQLVAAGRRQRHLGDQLQEPDQGHTGFQLRVNVRQLHAHLRDRRRDGWVTIMSPFDPPPKTSKLA